MNTENLKTIYLRFFRKLKITLPMLLVIHYASWVKIET
jgi:hypothetical protein